MVKNVRKGFTLIELIVVIGIFLVVTGIVLFNSKGFDSNITASNLAQDVALTIRKADAYTLGFQTPAIATSTQIKGYGVSFVAGVEKSFILFGETLPPDQHYTNSGVGCGPFSAANECIEATTISTPDRLSRISVETGTGTTVLGPGDVLSIIFAKPTGEVSLCVQSGGGGPCTLTLITVAHITITSVQGRDYTVNVWNNGQINVQ